MNTDAVSVDKESGVQRVKFNVQNFQPEEIDLKVVDNILRVHAVHKSTADGSNVHREYRLDRSSRSTFGLSGSAQIFA